MLDQKNPHPEVPAHFGRASKDGRETRRLRAGVFLATLLALPFAANAQQRDEGERAFQKCYSCHSVDPREKDLSGPSLAGVIGRRAASLPNFEYSPAMKKAGAGGLVWTEETLERYLADPLEAVPGTTMGPVPLKDAAERRAVIAYLKRFR